jgi:HAD superfamily hydrolase (TIGR01450 family)
MEPSETGVVSDVLRELRGFAFDLDGTIWEGPVLLPGAAGLVADLRDASIRVVFASNCSRSGSSTLCRRLGELGIDAKPDDVLTPFELVGDEVRRRLGHVPVLVIGTDDLGRILKTSGHSPVPLERWEEAKAVVVGVDTDFSYARLTAAARAVAAGASFFAVNLDARFPVGPDVFDPGCGALAAAISVAGGSAPVAIGKPEQPLFHAAIERLGCPGRLTAMVGDSTSSDIAGGRAAGMFTIWVDSQNHTPKPDSADLKVRDLAELRRLWRQARNRGETDGHRTVTAD